MTIHGFELIKEQMITELDTRARWFRHTQTGAQLLSLENNDENKSFGITFRTPPSDSTGVAHILEHAVLNGSRRYPVKEPFTQMVKGSLRTFLNAITFPDKTAYPVASQNLQDFYNLVDVYFDAVFHPLITPETLAQEGWHYELTDPSAPLVFKGVVFNEMKGAYSSPDNALYRHAQNALFPDNTYGLDSGGDPQHIPDLTHAQFVHFYRTYYHPSNARIWFYGDDDPDERLRRTHEVLQEFEARPVDSTIALQPRNLQPRRFTFPFDASADAKAHGQILVNWMLDEYRDAESLMALDIWSYLLLGTQAAPLRKALLDSGLGEEVTGGLTTSLRQMTFAAGLKGIAPANADKVEALIVQTLETLARDGFNPELVEAALNTIEFRLRENNTGSFPRGLSLMFRTLTTWLYDHDPFDMLGFEAPLRAVKQRVAAGEPIFSELIRQQLLDNTHRVTVVVEPDPALRAREDAAEQERLARARAAMSEAAAQAVVANTHKLKQMQETPDAPQALATLPMLKVSDLDQQSKTLPLHVWQTNGSALLYHDLFTNGIAYLEAGFDMRALSPELLPYVPLFGRALLEMGTEKEDYVKLSMRIGRKTGGIGRASLTSLRLDDGKLTSWFFLRGKATMAQTDELVAIMRDVLLTVKLDNRERFKQMVLQEKARQEAGIIPSGNAFAASRLRSHFNTADWAGEQMGGVSYLFFLRTLADAVENDWPSVLAKLEAIHSALINRRLMLCNVTLDAANWAKLEPKLVGLVAAMPASPITTKTWPAPNGTTNEGLTVPSKVNYVVQGDNLYKYGYVSRGSTLVATRLLSIGYLHDKLRVMGGAYGAGCSFDRNTGIFAYSSYRDPNLLGTLDNYDGAAQFLRDGDITEDELHQNIIGLIGQLDFYQLPDAKGYTSLARYLTGVTDESRQTMRDEILATTIADVRTFADMLEQVKANGTVVVVGSPEAIEAANKERGGWLKMTKVI